MYKHSDVWIDGQHLGFHPHDYTSFACDLTPYAYFGAESALAVRLDQAQYLDVQKAGVHHRRGQRQPGEPRAVPGRSPQGF